MERNIEAENVGIALIKFKNRIVEGTTDIYPKNLEDVKTKCHENSPNVYGHTSLYPDVINASLYYYDNLNDNFRNLSEEVERKEIEKIVFP